MSLAKTNAMRLFEAEHLAYSARHYGGGEFCDALSVAAKLGVEAERVFKTLVAQGQSGQHYVFVLPASAELDLKKAAKAGQEKSMALIPLKDLRAITGYIRGACSPFAMKKHFPTFFDESAWRFSSIFVSAGILGCQIEAAPGDMLALARASRAPLAKS